MSVKVFRVGLTGGIASGKSTVTKLFQARGVPVIDTDELAREVVEPGQPPLEQLVARFGSAILTSDGRLDRPALRSIVFSDPKARNDLEALTHPAIGAALEKRSLEAGGPYQVLVIPLLVEKNLGSRLDRVLVVDCDEALQIRRLFERDGASPEEARAILNAQAARATRLKAAHDVIENDGKIGALAARVAALHAQYLRYASAARG